MTISPRAIEAAARAIIKARQEWSKREGPFGVYYLPYSVAGQHAVRDFRPGAEAKIVSRFDTHEEAMAECALLTEQHFLAAALAVDGLCLVPSNILAELRKRDDTIKQIGPRGEELTERVIANECANAWPIVSAMLAAASTGDSPRQEKP